MSDVTQPTARLRASLTNAAFAVEDRVAIGGSELARGARELAGRAGAAMAPAVDAAKWPFERLAWAIQEHLVWPLQDRTDGWSRRTRAVGAGGVVLVALGACAVGLALASGGGGNSAAELTTAPAVTPPAPKPTPVEKAPAAPVLQGVAPTFKPVTGVSDAKGTGQSTTGAKAKSPSSPGAAAPDKAPDPAIASVVGTGEPAGPAALKVAHRFANAFVLYEIGQRSAKARAAFSATATPELTRSLLHRPPRLPANVKVPKAKVVNVVAAPSHGGVFPVSVSLLRVGVTSELRLNMQKGGGAKGGGAVAAGKARQNQKTWRVTEVTG